MIGANAFLRQLLARLGSDLVVKQMSYWRKADMPTMLADVCLSGEADIRRAIRRCRLMTGAELSGHHKNYLGAESRRGESIGGVHRENVLRSSVLSP